MNKEDYIEIANEKLNNSISKKIMIHQIDTYYNVKKELVKEFIIK